MRLKPGDLVTVLDVEREIDAALKDLRALETSSNLMAKAATENRIGQLRRRKSFLEWLPAGGVPSNSLFRR